MKQFHTIISAFFLGIQLLGFVLYNYIWSINLTVYELDREQLALRSTTKVLIGAMYFSLTCMSSLYNLLFIGLLRMFAIWKPIRYKNQSKSIVPIGLAFVWILATVSSTITGKQSKLYFNYSTLYNAVLLNLFHIPKPFRHCKRLY